MPILVGTDGKMKMSKSYKNHIPVSTTPDDMFGKIMSIQDNLMESYAKLLTDIGIEKFMDLVEQNPRQAKALLAKEIVSQFFTEEEAERAEMAFNRIFREKQTPENIPVVEIPLSKIGQKRLNIADVLFLAGLVPSKSEAKRMIQQNAVKVDGETITDINADIEPDGKVFKVGKRKFGRIRII